MSLHSYSEPRLYIGNIPIDSYSKINYKNKGANKVSSLRVTITDPEMDEAAFMGSELIFYLNYGSSDAVPFFRGFVTQIDPSDKSINITAHDAMTFLAGTEVPPLVITENSNFDGFTLAQMLHDYIERLVNKKGVKIGLDMLNDTDPPVTLTGYRNTKGIQPLKIIQQKIPKNTSTLSDIRNYRLVVRDDGTKSNICFVVEQDIDSAGVNFSFNDGIEKLQYKRRPSPNYYTSVVEDSIMEYQHNSLPTGIHSGKLQGKFAYPDAARQEAFFTATAAEDKKEITLTTSKGHYLEIGNIVNLNVTEYPELIGKHRILSKDISVSDKKITCKLKLSKEGPTVTDYLQLT